MPYDRFVKLQLAADQMPGTSRRIWSRSGSWAPARSITRTAGSRRTSSRPLHRRLGRAHRHRLARLPGHDGRLRPLPRSQVRSDPDEGLLQPGGRLRVDRAVPRPLVGDRSGGRNALHGGRAAALLSQLCRQPAARRAGQQAARKPAQKVGQFVDGDGEDRGRNGVPEATSIRSCTRSSRNWPSGRNPYPDEANAAAGASRPQTAAGRRAGRRRPARRLGRSRSSTPCSTPALWSMASDPDFTMIDIKPGEPRDMHVLPGGNVASPAMLRRADSCRSCRKTIRHFTTARAGCELAEQDLQRRRPAGRARDRQSRLGLALWQAARRDAKRFRRAGRKADASASCSTIWPRASSPTAGR